MRHRIVTKLKEGFCDGELLEIEGERVGDLGFVFGVGALGFGGVAEVGGGAVGGFAGHFAIGKSLVESAEAGFVELGMVAVAGVNLLDVGFGAVSGRVESGATKGFGEVGGESEAVVGMEVVVERVGGEGIGEAELMPTVGEGEYPVESSEIVVEAGHGAEGTRGGRVLKLWI